MMGVTEFVSNNIKFVWHSAPVQLAVLALELMAHYAASALESLVGLEEPKAPVTTPQDPVKKANHDNPMKENKYKDKAEYKSYVGGASLMARLKAYSIQAVQVLVVLLRCVEHWLRSLVDQAPSVDASVEERRRVVAKKRLEQLSLMTRVCRCALYAVTDTLRDIGVTVQWLECAKGTLHVSGNKKVDNSPVKGRTSVTPTKRKDFEESDDEEEETGLLDELERSYDSQEDEDYEPPCDADVSTDSEEYNDDGQTDDEGLELSGAEDPTKPLGPRVSIPVASAAQTADEKVKIQQVKESVGAAEDAGEQKEDEKLTLMEQLNKSYDSQDDADYVPPNDDDASTDSEEFKAGETESDLSDPGSTEEPIAPRRGKTTTATSKEATDEAAQGTGSVQGTASVQGKASVQGTASVQGKASVHPIKAPSSSENGVKMKNGVTENGAKAVMETKFPKVDPVKQKTSKLDRTP